MPVRSIAAFVACAAVLVATAPAAPAARVPLVRGLPAAGPVLATSERVVWVERRYDEPDGSETRGNGLFVRTLEGGRDSIAHVVQDPDPLVTSRVTGFAARGERFALAVGRWFRPAEPDERVRANLVGQDVRVADPGAPFRTLASCDRGAGDVALDAATLLTVLAPCAPLTARPAGRDEAGRPLEPDAELPRVAGRFAAWVELARRDDDPVVHDGAVVVHDLVAGREAYRLKRARVAGLDLQSDGKVVVAQARRARGGERTRVIVAGPRRAPRVLPLPRSGLYDVRLAGNRVVAHAFARPGPGREALILSDLRGRTRTIVRDAVPEQNAALFDFDGRAVTWVTPRACGRPTFELRTASLASLRRRAARATPCRTARAR